MKNTIIPSKTVCALALSVASILGLAGTARAAIITPVGLALGTPFRMAFVSSTVITGTSSNVADYDAFVTLAAVAAGIDTYNGSPVTWEAIVSTPTVSAISRLPASSPALYMPLGTGRLLAPSGTALWSGGNDNFGIAHQVLITLF